MTVAKLLASERLRKRLAKYVALHCFRNSQLEDHHSGITPSSKAGDYSDVKVVTPYGEIPWRDVAGQRKVSRISDEEMKELMIEVVNRTYTMLSMLAKSDNVEKLGLALQQYDLCPEWQEPEKIQCQTKEIPRTPPRTHRRS